MHLKEKFKKELDRLTQLDVIAKVDSPTDWEIRVYIDPKPLNRALKRLQYPFTTLEDVLPELAIAKVFSVADVKNGFWHVKLEEELSYLTTFGTPYGRFRWKRMPFGIAPAPEVFLQKLCQAIEGLPGVFQIADDILIVGEGVPMLMLLQTMIAR